MVPVVARARDAHPPGVIMCGQTRRSVRRGAKGAQCLCLGVHRGRPAERDGSNVGPDKALCVTFPVEVCYAPREHTRSTLCHEHAQGSKIMCECTSKCVIHIMPAHKKLGKTIVLIPFVLRTQTDTCATTSTHKPGQRTKPQTIISFLFALHPYPHTHPHTMPGHITATRG